MVSTLLLLALTHPVEPPIVSREAWGAKPRLAGAQPHVIREITIHHTGVATNPSRSLEDKLRGLQAFSQRVDKLADGRTKPAWVDIPYHYYIAHDGRIGEAREVWFAGDTNTEYDPTGHLLIVVEGNFETEVPTAAQIASMNSLTVYQAWKWRVPSSKIESHKDHSAQTSCPGKALYALMPALRERVASELGR